MSFTSQVPPCNHNARSRGQFTFFYRILYQSHFLGIPKYDGKNGERGAWWEEDTNEILQILVRKEFSVRETAHSPSVPKSLLQDRLRSMKKRSETKLKPELHWFETALSEEMEVCLVSHE